MASKGKTRVLLRARLSPPRLDGAVDRPRLLAAASHPWRRVTLFTAGPGMGKTWLAAALGRGADRCAWVSFEPADAEGFGAWSYIVEALAPFLPDDDDEVAALLAEGYERDAVERLAARLSNAFAGAADTVLVLDDAHALFGTDTWTTIVEWIRTAPAPLRFIVTAREEPAEYLGDLALHGALTHVDHEGFRLTPTEARAVLGSFEGLSLTPEAEQRLVARADGWVGALQMLAAAERIAPGPAGGGPGAMSAHLWGFLAREIVDSLDENERDVLVVAALLPTCEAPVLQRCFPEADMPRLLDGLQRRIPFLGLLRAGEDARRVHPLLASFLRERAAREPGRWTAALRRARDAYEEQAAPAAALEVALLLGERASILRLTRLLSSTALGAHYLLRIPRDCALADPEIGVQRAFIHYARNELAECRLLIDGFPADAPADLAQTMRFLSLMFTPPRAPGSPAPAFLPRFSAHSAPRAPRRPVAVTTRLIMLLRQATELNGRRRPGPALAAIEQLKAIDGWDGPDGMKFFALVSEAQIREECGELGHCLGLYDEVGAWLAEHPELGHLGAHVDLGRAGIYMKRFLLEQAGELLEKGRPLVEGQPGTLDAGFVINEVELLLCRGEKDRARALLLPLCAAPELHFGSAHYLFDMDRLGGVDEAMKAAFLALCDAEGPEGLTAEELMLQGRLAPDHPRSADRLEQALARMRADRYVSRLVDSLLLKAARGDRDDALDAVREALHYAAPEDFLMPFVVERELPTGILRDALADRSRALGARETDFLRRVIQLRTLRSELEAAPPVAPRDDAGLSAREVEVLLHMARGESNAQIAEALYVSLPTVKTHVARILSKLGAARRTEAVEAARRRGIITATGA